MMQAAAGDLDDPDVWVNPGIARGPCASRLSLRQPRARSSLLVDVKNIDSQIIYDRMYNGP